MQFVFRDALEKFSVLVCQFVIHVEVTNLFSVRHLRKIVVDSVDGRDDRHVIISRKEGGENDNGFWSLLLAEVHEGLQPARDVFHLGLAAGSGSGVFYVRYNDDY